MKLFLIPSIVALLGAPVSLLQGAIVGEDNRISYEQLNNFNPAHLAHATATQLSAKYLKSVDDKTMSYPTGQIQNQCPGEKFSNMRTLGGCSGFLIAPDILVTAGHCKDYSIADCSDDAWLFHHYSSPPAGKALVKKEDIYHCQEVLAYEHNQEADYAVLKLNRSVPNATVLKVDPRDQAELHDPVAILGYPLGLPFTYTPGGRILSKSKPYLQTDSDAFKNNSGSALVNLRTGYVEGILTNSKRGVTMNALDGCAESIHHPQDSYKTIINRLSRISYIQNHFIKEKKLSTFTLRSNCSTEVNVIAKYRSPKDHSWQTQVHQGLKPSEQIVIQTKYQSLFLAVKDSRGKDLIRGRDFYGFADRSRFEEFGFKEFTPQSSEIELCSQ